MLMSNSMDNSMDNSTPIKSSRQIIIKDIQALEAEAAVYQEKISELQLKINELEEEISFLKTKSNECINAALNLDEFLH